MNTKKYNKRTLLLILLALFIGGYQNCDAQSTQLSNSVIPIEELGISLVEYQDIQNHIIISLPAQCGPLLLELDKVYLLNRNTGNGKHVDVKLKPIPFLPMVDYNKKEEDNEKD